MADITDEKKSGLLADFQMDFMQLSVGQDGRLNRQITSLTKQADHIKPAKNHLGCLLGSQAGLRFLGCFNIINQMVFSFHLKTKKFSFV